MSRFLTVPSGRRAKWLVFGAWLLLIVVALGANLPGKFADAEKNESTSFLPGDAESTKALAATKQLQGAEQAPIVIVFRRDGGLTAADRARIARDRAELNGLDLRRTSRFAAPQFSQDGKAALLVASISSDGEGETIRKPVEQTRDVVSGDFGGLEVKVTGGAGFSADAIKVFENINGTLLLAAVAIVFVLLALIYRSPVFLWIPLFAVLCAEIMTRSLG